MFKNLFKFNEPIGRWKFFICILQAILLWLVLGGLAMGVATGLLLRCSLLLGIILAGILILYLLLNVYCTFVVISKRFWDLSGKKKNGILLFIAMVVLGHGLRFINIYVCGFCSLIFWIFLFFVRGKLVK